MQPSLLTHEEFEFTVFTPSARLDINPTPTLPQLTNTIRRNTRTLRNRLHSIHADSLFVSAVASAYNLPITTNARAGDWYVDPRQRAGGVYFKSTDGHTNEWGFSLRRLNLGLLKIVGACGALIVDSTRRGKRFPDALSKTVPIWIAVLNAALFPETFPQPVLHTSPLAVAPHEAAAIDQHLPRFLNQFLELGLDLAELRRYVRKPLRPLFVTPASLLPETVPEFPEFTPLVLVTASQMTKGEGTEGEYIQGAGDDHEGWAATSGITAATFWKHHETILAASEDLIEAVIADAVVASRSGIDIDGDGDSDLTLVKPTTNIFIASRSEVRAAVQRGEFLEGVAINCAETPLDLPKRPGEDEEIKTIINCHIPSGKRGNKTLRMVVPDLVEDLRGAIEKGSSAVFICDTGDDVAPAVALVFLSLFYDLEGKFIQEGQQKGVIDKTHIKRRLSWISAARSTANPARGLLNAVNSVLMGRGG